MLKLIQHNAGGVNLPDDPSLPFLLVVNLRPPEFLVVTFVTMHGGSELVRVQGDSREEMIEFIQKNDMARHPRLRTLTVTQDFGNEKKLVLFKVCPQENLTAPEELIPK